VTVGVIAEIESVVEPHVERANALICLAQFEELLFIDEAYDGNFLVAKGAEQLGGHLCDGRRGHGIGHSGGQVINGDGDLAIGLGSVGQNGA